MFKKILAIFVIALPLFFSSFPHNVTTFSDGGLRLPVIMYHSVLKDKARTAKYIIPPEKFEEDLIYLQEHGYETISAKQLIRYVKNGDALPEKPVMLTFDDGMYNNFYYIVPILEKYNAHAVFSVVGSYTDEYTASDIVNPNYSYMRWCDINSIITSPNVEFGNHSYDLHTIGRGRYGAKRKKGEDKLEYFNLFHTDTKKLQSAFQANCNFTPYIYTYPFGEYTPDSTRVLEKLGILISFTCNEGINIIIGEPDCLYLLKRYNRDGRLESSDFFKKIGI